MTKNTDIPDPAAVALRLYHYCRERNWAGWDPFDALNSRLFNATPFRRLPLARLVLTQFLKRSPVNFRPLLLVPRQQNPKGLALFLSATVRLRQAGILKDPGEIRNLADALLDKASLTGPRWAWGYNFDWQMRKGFVPRGTPNIICTTFAANALLDADALAPAGDLQEAAAGAARYLLDELYQDAGSHEGCFSYTPLGATEIHNANLLGAALVARAAARGLTDGSEATEKALRSVRYSVNRQLPDGAWYYGERDRPSQKWIDGFHTGFNLCALKAVKESLQTGEFDRSLVHGYRYYLENFFTDEGAPKYFHDRLHPIDAHSASQALITTTLLKDLHPRSIEIRDQVYAWTIRNLQSRSGYFYYQKLRWGRNRIPYMRWSQAWMLIALALPREPRSH